MRPNYRLVAWYCIYSVVQKCVFAPQGRHIAPINVKFGTGERTAPRAKFHVHRGRNVGITAPQTVTISNFGHKFAHQERLVSTIFTKF